jgi:hypothetical protein
MWRMSGMEMPTWGEHDAVGMERFNLLGRELVIAVDDHVDA